MKTRLESLYLQHFGTTHLQLRPVWFKLRPKLLNPHRTSAGSPQISWMIQSLQMLTRPEGKRVLNNELHIYTYLFDPNCWPEYSFEVIPAVHVHYAVLSKNHTSVIPMRSAQNVQVFATKRDICIYKAIRDLVRAKGSRIAAAEFDRFIENRPYLAYYRHYLDRLSRIARIAGIKLVKEDEFVNLEL